MKIRLYLNDFTLCADIGWTGTILPQKGDMILIQEFINLEKGTTNVKSFDVYEGMCSVFNVFRFDKLTDKQHTEVKQMKEVIFVSSVIWRKIDNVIVPCFRVNTVNEHGVIDAYYKNEQMN